MKNLTNETMRTLQDVFDCYKKSGSEWATKYNQGSDGRTHDEQQIDAMIENIREYNEEFNNFSDEELSEIFKKMYNDEK